MSNRQQDEAAIIMIPMDRSQANSPKPTPAAPFTIDLLKAASSCAGSQESNATQPDGDDRKFLFPASYRTKEDHLVAAHNVIPAIIKEQLNLKRLDRIYKWIWLAGRPMPPRPLHYQLLVGHEIFVTEQMDLHLVWRKGQMHLKPIPRFLLDKDIWREHFSCKPDCSSNVNGNVSELGSNDQQRGLCEQCQLRKCALGFLFSYVALIRYESDLAIAKERNLIPKTIEWPAWVTFVEELDTEHIYSKIHRRFLFGELRLNRLNTIYKFTQGFFGRGYRPRWRQYNSFFHDTFTWLASMTVYIVIVLTAMQVGLATEALGQNYAFQSASYGFTVFSIVGPLAAASIILLAFIFLFTVNLTATLKYKAARFNNMKTGGV